ncbi:hypothetical protein STENM327S_02928 [Streptomyces tendae]
MRCDAADILAPSRPADLKERLSHPFGARRIRLKKSGSWARPDRRAVAPFAPPPRAAAAPPGLQQVVELALLRPRQERGRLSRGVDERGPSG